MTTATKKIQPGYKQTEVGVIPEDWEVFTLDNIVEVRGGGTPSSFNKNFWNGDVNWFTPTEIGKSKYVTESQRKITAEGLRNSSATILPVGTVLLTSRAGIGDTAILLIDACTNQGFQSLIADKVDNEFLYYLVNSSYFQKALHVNASGSTFLEISPKKLKSIQIALPPTKSEQTAIATALSDMDALIAAQEQLIAKKRAIKQGAMQELLEAKEGWEVKMLKDIIHSFQNGYGFSADGYSSSGTPIVTMAQIGLDGSFKIDDKKMRYWDIRDFNQLKSFHLTNGDVIIAMTDVTPQKNLIGRMTIVRSNKTLLLNQRVGHIRIDKSKINALFLTTYSNMRKWRDYCIGSASLGVQSNIGTMDILNGEIILPPIEEQTRIAQILSDMDGEIEQLGVELAKLRGVKKGMMEELLTGRKRLTF